MKIIKISIPILFLALSIFIMEGGRFIKKTGRGKEVNELFESILTNIEKEDFDEAIDNSKSLKEIFEHKKKVLQFSIERDEINEFIVSLVKLEEYIKNKEKHKAILETKIIKTYWDELGK